MNTSTKAPIRVTSRGALRLTPSLALLGGPTFRSRDAGTSHGGEEIRCGLPATRHKIMRLGPMVMVPQLPCIGRDPSRPSKLRTLFLSEVGDHAVVLLAKPKLDADVGH